MAGRQFSLTSGRMSWPYWSVNYLLHICIYYKPERVPSADVVITDRSVFDDLRRRFPNTSINPNFFSFDVDYRDAAASGLLDELNHASGKRGVADLMRACEDPSAFYVVKVVRRCEPEDLDQCRWLLMELGLTSLAKDGGVAPDGGYSIGKRTKGKANYGSDFIGPLPGWMHLLSEKLKDEFLKSGLKVDFRPVPLTKGGDSGLWQLHTELRMPPLAMKFRDSHGRPCEAGLAQGGLIDDYYPYVFKYEEAAVRELPPFDVAFSAETFGFAHQLHRRIIVSQDFRRVAQKLARGSFPYGVVTVGSGQELQARYRIPELQNP